ncbi:MAG: caspase family protein [Bacteroidetes bacterium]|nr:caspase family protein [Bacteroidota bacterium]
MFFFLQICTTIVSAQLPFRLGVKGFDGSESVEQLLPDCNAVPNLSPGWKASNHPVIIGYGERNITMWDPLTLNVISSTYVTGNAEYIKIIPPLPKYRGFQSIKAFGLLGDNDTARGVYGHLFFTVFSNGQTSNEGRINIPDPIVDMAAGEYAAWFISRNKICHHYVSDTQYHWWTIPIQNPDLIEHLDGGIKTERLAVTTNFKKSSQLRLLTFYSDSWQLSTDTVLKMKKKISFLLYSTVRKKLFIGMENGSVYSLKDGSFRIKKEYSSGTGLNPVVQMQFAGENDKFLYVRNEYSGLKRVSILPPLLRPFALKLTIKLDRFAESFLAEGGGDKYLILNNHDLEFGEKGNKKTVEIKTGTVRNYMTHNPLQVSPDGRFVTGMGQLLDLKTGMNPTYHWFPRNTGFNPGSFTFSTDGQWIAGEVRLDSSIAGEKKRIQTIRLIHANSGKTEHEFTHKGSTSGIEYGKLFFSETGDTLWKYYNGTRLIGWQLSTGNRIAYYQLNKFTGKVSDGPGHQDYLPSKSLFSISGDSFFLANLATGDILLNRAFEPRYSVYKVKLNPAIFILSDSTLLISHRQYYDSAEIYHIKNNTFTKIRIEHPVNDVAHMPGDSVLVAATDFGQLFWIHPSGRIIKQRDVASSVKHLAFLPEKKIWYIQTETQEISCRSENLDSTLYTIYPAMNTSTYEMSWILSDGYHYMCNPEHVHYVYHVNKENGFTYSAREYELLLNRPDIILRRMGHAEGTMVALLNQLWERRLRLLGFDSAQYAKKLLEGENPDAPHIYSPGLYNEKEDLFTGNYKLEFPEITHKRHTDIHCTVESFHEIEGVDFTLNGNRNKIRNRYLKVDHTGWTATGSWKEDLHLNKLPIEPGMNHFQINFTDTSGFRSKPFEKWVYCTRKGEIRRNVYVLGLGVSHYLDSQYNLEYAARDARSVTEYFQQQGKKIGFHRVKTKLLTDRQVHGNPAELLGWLSRARPKEVVVVFMAGHGLLDSQNRFCFAPWNMNFTNPEKTGFNYNKLVNTVDKLEAGRKLILLDACHSGTLITLKEKDTVLQHDSLVAKARGARMENSQFSGTDVISAGPLMDQILGSYKLNSGTTVIAAADGTGYAYESGDLKHGLFTWCLLEILNNPANRELTVLQLQQKLNARVQEISGSNQQIRVNTFNPEGDWKIKDR